MSFDGEPLLKRPRSKSEEEVVLKQSEISLKGLADYFASVSATGLAREEKLAGIVATFSDDTVVVKPDGEEVKGKDGVTAFYGSDMSPVMKMPDFKPVPDKNTLCVSPDGSTIAVEIDLPLVQGGYTRVGDFFTFDTEGRISRLRIFQWPMNLAK